MLLFVPASWLLAHRFSSRGVPPAPWSERELPAIPAAAENGLAEVVLPGRWSFGVVDPALNDLVKALDAQRPDARWTQAGRRQREISAWIGSDRERRARELAMIDAALATPYFAEPCVTPGSDCRIIDALKLARVVVISDLDAALRGDWPGAFSRSLAFLVASKKLLTTTRTLVGSEVAMVFARMATDHVRVLAAGYRGEVAGGSPRTDPLALRPTFDAVAAALDAPRPGDLSARRLVTSECLWVRGNVRPALEDPAILGGRGGSALRYLVDVRGTMAASDARCVELMNWVQAPDHSALPAPSFHNYASGPGWWLWNPGGKSLLDLLTVDLGPAIEQHDRNAAALLASHRALQSELRVLAP